MLPNIKRLATRSALWLVPLSITTGFALATPEARRTIAIGDLTLTDEHTRSLLLALYVGLADGNQEMEDHTPRSVDTITQNTVISSSSVNHITQNTVISSSSVNHITQNTVISSSSVSHITQNTVISANSVNHITQNTVITSEADLGAILPGNAELPSPQLSAELLVGGYTEDEQP